MSKVPKLRVFYDGRIKRITKVLKEIGGVKVEYVGSKKGVIGVRYKELSKYDWIVSDAEWVMSLRDRSNTVGVWDSWALDWRDRYITVDEFFQKVNEIRNIKLIEKL